MYVPAAGVRAGSDSGSSGNLDNEYSMYVPAAGVRAGSDSGSSGNSSDSIGSCSTAEKINTEVSAALRRRLTLRLVQHCGED